jgi:hypothetical protein
MTTTAAYDLQISDDGLEATLTVPRGASEVPEPDEFLRYLAEEEGLIGVDEDAVFEVLEAAQAGKRGGPAVIARGEEPIDGDDACLEWLGEFFERVPLHRPDGSVDHFHRNKTSVAPETVLARWVPPTEGTPGRTVRGVRIDPEPGRPWRPKLHHTVAWTDEDHTHVQSLVGGQVEYAKGRVSVSQIYKASAVDFSTASIDFDGAVEVKGDVLEGFDVHATGSIAVSGYVESAPLQSGASITVQQGIIGRNKIAVRADGDVEVGFAREFELNCGGQLVSKGELMRLSAVVGGDVTATGNRLVGGTWQIGGSLYVAELGSESEVPTSISVGIDPDLEGKQAEQIQERADLQIEIEKRQEQIEAMQRKRKRTEKENLVLQKLEVYLQQLQQKDQELSEAERLLRRRIKMRRRYGMVWVDEGVHPGVKIWAGGKNQPLEVTTYIRGPVRIGYMPGRQKPAITHGRNKKFDPEW